MKKILLMILCLIILSGCSANVNVDVLKNGNVKETVILTAEKSDFSEDTNFDDVIENYLNTYKDMLDGYKYNDVSTDNMLSFKFEKEFDDVCDYFKSSIFVSNNINNLDCDSSGTRYILNANVNNLECGEDCLEGPLIDKATFELSSTNRVIKNNSDNVIDNKYEWNFEGTHDKTINLVIDKSVSSKINNTIKKNNGSFIAILILIPIMLFIILFVILRKKYKENQIDF